MFGYRNKMEFSCSDRRSVLPHELERTDTDSGFALGLHVPGTFHKVIDIRHCLLQPALGNQLMAEVRTFVRSSDKPVYGLRSHIGFWRFLVVRHSVAHDQWMVNIVTAEDSRSTVQPLADRLMDRYPKVVSVINNITSRKAGVAVGEFEHTLAGADFITDKIAGFEFEISANSFSRPIPGGRDYFLKLLRNTRGSPAPRRFWISTAVRGSFPFCCLNIATPLPASRSSKVPWRTL